MLIYNTKKDAKLVNESMGFAKDVIYMVGTSPHSLPMFVLVDFGTEYNGEKFSK